MKEMLHPRIRAYATLSDDAVIYQLYTDETGPKAVLGDATYKFGLTSSEVPDYRKHYGSNEQLKAQETSLFDCVRRAFINPFSIILFVLALISLLTDILMPDGYGQGISSVVIILGMLVLSGVVRLVQEIKAKQVSDALIDLVQTTVSVCRDGNWVEIPADEVVVGDVVRLEAGDRVPADVRIIKSRDLFVSQSVITGESGSLEKHAYALESAPEGMNDYINTIFMGTTVTGGKCQGLVLAVGADTVYGSLNVTPSHRKQEFDKSAASIAWVLIKFMGILVPVVFLACGLTKGNWIEALLFALSVAVGLTPELLPMVVNACLAKGSFQMGRKQTIVKNINAMQMLGSMDVLCVDKTGTLTGDTVMLEYYMDILGNENRQVLDYALLNSYYHSGVKNHIDSAVLSFAHMPGVDGDFEKLTKESKLLDEQPFDYSHKYVGVLLDAQGCQGLGALDEQPLAGGDKCALAGEGSADAAWALPTGKNIHIIKGSVENVVAKCSYVKYKDKVVCIRKPSAGDAPDVSQSSTTDTPATDTPAIPASIYEGVHAIVDELTEDGMKVVAVAYKHTDATTLDGEEDGFILLGYLGFFDAPKASAKEAIKRLEKRHIDIRILTGDDVKTTLSICSRLGLPTDQVMTGAEFDALVENDIHVTIERTTIFAELTPKQKSRIVEVLQQNGHTVGFLGDGMNDLPAELQAHVGISVDNAAEAVKESADVILLKKDLNVLEQGILEGRRAFTNLTKYIKITASSNFGNICAVVVASILLPFFPMTSLQLLSLNLLYDILCLILPWDNVDEEQLQTPIRWSANNLGRFMLQFGSISSVFDVLTFAFLFFILCPMMCGGEFASLGAAGQLAFVSIFQTGWFIESMWTQVLILQLLRTSKVPFTQSRPSRVVTVGTLSGVVLFTLMTVTPIGDTLGLTAMPAPFYAFLLLDVVGYLISVSIAKYLYYRKHRELL